MVTGLRGDRPAIDVMGLVRAETATGRRLRAVTLWLAVVPLAYLVLAPLVHLQRLAMDDGGAAYDAAFGRRGFVEVVWTTVYLALGSLLIAMVAGTFLAWMSTRLPRRWQWLSALPILPIVMPAVAFVTGWAFLLSPRPGYLNNLLRKFPFFSDLRQGPIDVYTRTWIVLLTGIALTAFIYVFMRSGMRRLNAALTEAAYVSGASATRAFFTVVFPLLRPSLVYGGSIALLLGLGQFTGPLLLGRPHAVRVLTTEVYRYTTEQPVDYGMAAAVASPLLIVGVVLILVQRMLLSNQDRFVSDVGKGVVTAVRPARTAPLFLVLYASVAVVLPFGAVILVSISPYWSGDVDLGALTLDNFRVIWNTDWARRSIRTSLFAATSGVLLAIPVGYFAAEVIYRKRGGRFIRALVDLLVNIPLGIPAVVFGAGFLFTYSRGPFVLYGTMWVIIIVYVTIMIPFSTRLQLAARLSLGSSFEEAARVSGASAFRTHLSILIPMTRGAIAGAATLMFVLLSHEFSASLLVRSTRTHLMGTALYEFWVTSSYSVTAAMAVVMSVVTTIGVALAIRLGGGAQMLDQL